MIYLSAVVSGAASVGVLMGLISGIFFLVLSGLRWVSRVRASLCDEEFDKDKEYLIRQAYPVPSREGSVPGLLETSAGTKFNRSLYLETQLENDNNNERDIRHIPEITRREPNDNQHQLYSNDTMQIRELLEKIVEAIIGDSLDEITVGRLSKHSSYLAMFEKYHTCLCRKLAKLALVLHLPGVRGSEPEVVKSSLNRLIQRIINEAMTLPNIKEILCRSVQEDNKRNLENEGTDDKSYEDILATAILNKVIEKFQNGLNSVESDVSGKPEVEGSDLEDSYYNIDWSETSRPEQISLMVEEHIEEVTTAFEISDEERESLSQEYQKATIYFPESGKLVRDAGSSERAKESESETESSATELVTSSVSWEENWLFQKRRLRSTPNAHHPVPVPMLVPNPSEDFRALVGGVDADDLSDVSDFSDSVLEDPMTKTLNLVVNKRSGEFDNPSNDEANNCCISDDDDDNNNNKGIVDSDLDTEMDAAKEDDRILANDSEANLNGKSAGAREELDGSGTNANDDPDESLCSLPQENVKGCVEWVLTCDTKLCKEQPEESTGETESYNNRHVQVRCRIAEREKQKWNHPVSIPENPYSLESIRKRDERKKNEFFHFGTYLRDYEHFASNGPRDEFSNENTDNLRFMRDYYMNVGKKDEPRVSPRNTWFSSSSSGQFSDGNEQEFNGSASELYPGMTPKDYLLYKVHESKGDKNTCKREFSLPNVKELAKQFTVEEHSNSGQGEIEGYKTSGKKDKSYQRNSSCDEKEPEIDYSPVPVAEIILNLTSSVASTVPPRTENRTMKEAGGCVTPRGKAPANAGALDDRVQCKAEQIFKKMEEIGTAKFNGKQVHSLTARSISKEFREGLKNNSTSKMARQITDETSYENVVNQRMKCSSPPPSIDLKTMTKFWEEIITANSTVKK